MDGKTQDFEQRFAEYRKHESHANYERTRYWCDQYKRLCHDMLAALAQPAQGEAVVKRDAIMAQAQVFASAWSLVGGPFDDGDALENAEHEKIELQRMVSKILAAPQPPADTIAVPRSGWVSVSERMPDKACLAFYTNKLGNPRIVKAKYTPRFTHEAHGDCADEWCEYSEEHDEYFYPEGWYECIDNWDDYAFVTINDATVTHWMPLPEYPAKSTGEDVCKSNE